MNQLLARFFGICLFLSFYLGMQPCFSQSTTLSGNVTDAANNEPLVGVNVSVKGKLVGTVTDARGNFSLTTNTPPPFMLVFSTVGFESQEVEVSGDQSAIAVSLKEQVIMGQEVVVAASRMEESILESPVSIEKMDLRTIRETPAANFYDALANIKGIDLNTQSLTFKSVNTRGFNANGNVRVVQLIDGMDNQAPGLNFSVGNIVGISEIDLESVEVLPGASSALYGPNAIQGIILMTSKNPFQYQGLSANAKVGLMNVGREGVDPSFMREFSARYAKAFNNKFAFKVNASYLAAVDWRANDFRDKNAGLQEGSTRQTNPNFNGVNTYGDEAANSFNLQNVANNEGFIQQVLTPASAATGLSVAQLQAIIPNQEVTRTGYEERELANYDTESIKLSAALHYRITEDVEAILQGNYGTGTTMYTGIDRYSLTGFNLSQYKAEVKGSNFFVRAYTTQERSGDSYSTGTLGIFMNEAYKPGTRWFPEYTAAFLQARLLGQGQEQAHNSARTFADQGRFLPGSAQFNAAKDQIINTPIPRGARFTDKTNLYHAEAMYNFNKHFNFAEVVVGANYRLYDLNSEGTLFLQDDDGEEFNINEYGAYVQAAKKLFADRLKLTGSIRYDKNQNFKGQFSPRLSAVYTVANTHNFRVSYQTGFRIPNTQEQYIDLNTPQARLIGGLPIFQQRFNLVNNPAYTLQNVEEFGAAVQTNATAQSTIAQAVQLAQADAQAGRIPATEAAVAAQAQLYALGIGYQLALSSGVLQPYQFKEFKPERVQSYEIGYKSLIANKLMIDAYYYYNSYKSFVRQPILLQANPTNGPSDPLALLGLAGTRGIYASYASSEGRVNSHGWALGLDYSLPKGYTLGGNVAYNALIDADSELGQIQFNTPRYRSNVTLGNRNVFKNIGFNIAWRWQDAFLWESSFTIPATNTIVPAFNTIDAQISYKIAPLKSILKIGGSNIFNQYYTQAFGNPSIGGLYYISLTFDELLN
ncbi:TonB-dependent receptor [Rhodocytophaga aerolata]|uniref:TonB-dependent receptor n=1 Tax=Rhodocytophaga aerolata TaxID=455078 RepID=A0ABT8QZC7_9BACT|nr:TonB-dependent receptor [Rhodocytophaga aerolata]MDO1445199.1 TonB-dependent receptor [Rhodocytophaga aerolata]